MAKSMELVCIGVLLMMAMLPVITGQGSPSGGTCLGRHCISNRVKGLFGTSEKEIREVEKIEASERNYGQWKMLAESSMSKLGTSWDRISSETVQKLVDTLLDTRKHQPDLSFDLFSIRWNNLLDLWQDSVGCAGNFNGKISLALVADKNLYDKRQRNFVLLSFRNYLEKCGPEENFRKATSLELPGYWDTDKFPTLSSYLLRDKFLKSATSAGIAHHFSREVDRLLSDFKSLSELKDITNGADCEKEEPRHKLLGLLAVNARKPDMYNQVRGHFELYLHKCGFEERFKKASVKHGFAIDKGNSPLASYLWAGYLQTLMKEGRDKFVENIIFALDVLDKLRNLDEGYEFDCRRGAGWRILNLLSEAKNREINRFVRFLEDVLRAYLKACPNDAKSRFKANLDIIFGTEMQTSDGGESNLKGT